MAYFDEEFECINSSILKADDICEYVAEA